MPRPCTHCGSVEHTQFYCRRKPRKPIKTRLPVKRNGKVSKQWRITRETWFKRHPAAYYECYICGRSLTKAQTTLDHIKSRSRYPELRYTMSNLAPCCSRCNYQKGSKDLEQL